MPSQFRIDPQKNQSTIECESTGTDSRALVFLKMLTAIQAEFISREAGEIDTAIVNAQRRVCRFFGTDRAALWQGSKQEPQTLRLTHLCTLDEIRPVPDGLTANVVFPYITNELLAGRTVIIHDVNKMTPEATVDRDNLIHYGDQGTLAIPFVTGAICGALSFAATTAHPNWTDAMLPECTLVAHVFSGALARRNAAIERNKLEMEFAQSQKMESIGRLAGGVAHDFNNLLMVIQSHTEMLQQCLPIDSPLRRRTTVIAKACERAAGLTGQLLALSRKQIIRPVTLNLNAAIDDTVRMIRRLIGEDIEVRVDPAKSLWNVMADPDQVAQVLMNLAVNARDAMPMGGRLTIATANVTAVGEGKKTGHPIVDPGDYVRISVTDTGCGISKEISERVFEPFFTTKEVGKGTGLGLSTVYGIVKQNGGYVSVESEPGQGTCFIVYLPRTTETISPKEPERVEEPPLGTETILVVEDEEVLSAAVCEYLRGLGYTIIQAASGQEAISLVSQHNGNIHLLLTDLVMPGMSGRELSQMLGGLHPNLKTVYMSGYTDDPVIRHGIQDKQAAFLQKPFGLSSLAGKVRDMLRRIEAS